MIADTLLFIAFLFTLGLIFFYLGSRITMDFLFTLGLIFFYLEDRITILEQRIDYLVEKLYSQPEEIIDVEDE